MPVPIRRAYIDNIWGQMHYRIARPSDGGMGSQPPLLCIHITPKSGWVYEPIMGLLGQDRVVIAPDTPGYGASDGPPAPVTIPDYARAMAHLIDDLALAGQIDGRQFDVMGYHTGSVTSPELARQLPDRVRRLVLISLPVFTPAERADRIAKLDMHPIKEDGSHIRVQWTKINELADPRASLEWRHASFAQNQLPGNRMNWGYQAVYHYDLGATLSALNQPILVINPEDDLWEETHAAKDLLRHGTVIDLPGVMHGLMAVDPPGVVGMIRGFLDG